MRIDDTDGALVRRTDADERAFSQQDAGKSVKHGSRILRGVDRGFLVRSGLRILRCLVGWKWRRHGRFVAWCARAST